MRSIVFLDLDGTFWDELDVVPASTMEAIRLAQANGHVVFSNTGRSRGGTRDLTGYGLNGRSYAAGSEVFVGDKKIQDRPLTLEESLALRNSLDFGSVSSSPREATGASCMPMTRNSLTSSMPGCRRWVTPSWTMRTSRR